MSRRSGSDSARPTSSPTSRSTSARARCSASSGPTASGKTTTMRMILDIIRPDRGSITRVRRATRASSIRRASATCPRIAASTGTCPSSTRSPTSARCAGCRSARRTTRAARLLREMGLGRRDGQEGRRAVTRHAPEGAAHRDDPQRAGPAHRRRAVPGPRPGQRRDAQGGPARAARPRRGRDHEHPRHGRCADAVRPHPAHRQGPAAPLRHGPDVRDAFSDGAVEVHGQDIPTDADDAAQRRPRHERPTARCATCSATGATPRDLFRSWPPRAPRSSASRSRRPTSTRSSSAPSPATRARRPCDDHRRGDGAAAGPRAGRTSWLRLSLLVARRDYVRTVRRRGFIFGTLLLPLGIAALVAHLERLRGRRRRPGDGRRPFVLVNESTRAARARSPAASRA